MNSEKNKETIDSLKSKLRTLAFEKRRAFEGELDAEEFLGACASAYEEIYEVYSSMFSSGIAVELAGKLERKVSDALSDVYHAIRIREMTGAEK